LTSKAEKMRDSRDLRAAIAAGADLRDERNRRRYPLGPASLRKLISLLAAILDDAIEDGHIERNAARNKRMRVRVPKPQRSFLELDELRALMAAAAAQDPAAGRVKPPSAAGETAHKVAEMLTRGMSQDAIAEALGRTKATINWHARRMSVVGAHTLAGRSLCASWATAACATASSPTCVSATSASTTAAEPASTSRTPRPRPVSAKW
jgi:integrase